MIVFAWFMVVVFCLIAIWCGVMVISAASDKSGGGDLGQALSAFMAVVFLVAGCLSATAAATIAILASR